ncbi:MAG TPA: fused response regulator/phosphatase, partial [Sulfitobacter pontiacus]|nr:fused response regulator/phosphatase [Sulfitobacter pontiacus]
TPQRFRAIKTAMVVDDSALQRRILMATLSRWGFDVQEAASAEEALAVCEQNLPDLIISDWIMPGMSGLQFCEAFRKLSKGSYGYFILLTAKSDKSEVVKGLDSGADDFVSKPVNVDELRARIMAGERILTMQRELSSKNRVISEALDALQNVHDALDRDLDEARKFQKSLLQEPFCAFDAGAVSLMLRSSGHVGGDLVGYFTAGNSIGIYGLDVSG